MRPSAIASLGGACLLLAATAAVGSTTTSSSLSKPPAADQPPATATASGPQSDSNGQYYRQRNDRSGKSQNKSISDRRPAFQRGTYVLQHPDDWDPGAYFYNQTSGRQFIQRRDRQQDHFAFGAARYYGTWYEQNRDENPQLQPQERRQVLHALMRLKETDRDRLIERFGKLNREDRQRMRSLFGIDEKPTLFDGRSNQHKSDGDFNRPRNTQGRKWEPTGKGQASRNPVGSSRTSPSQTGKGQAQGEGRFLQQITQALQDQENGSLAAVHYAREHLTPEQRIAMFEPLLADPGGSREARNAAYLILIEAYRDMDNLQKSMKLAQAMVAENQNYQD